MINFDTFLDYEIKASWWASFTPRPLSEIVARYFAWKAWRKYRRYEYVNDLEKQEWL